MFTIDLILKYTNTMKNLILFILLLICTLSSIEAQYSTRNAHSHNDYSNDIPFWLAYYNHFGSIEADIFAVEGDLFVAHNKSELQVLRRSVIISS